MERPGLPSVLIGTGPFVGRGSELERLLSAWQTSLGGGACAALIAGEPGVGKTRLAGEWSRQAYEQGAVVLYGRCDEDLGAPYQPFAEALRSLVPCVGAKRLRGLRGVEALLPLVPGLDRRRARSSRADARRPGYRALRAIRRRRCTRWKWHPRKRRSSWFSTTCTGRPSQRCSCCDICCASVTARACRSSAPTAALISTAPTLWRRCWPTCTATAPPVASVSAGSMRRTSARTSPRPATTTKSSATGIGLRHGRQPVLSHRGTAPCRRERRRVGPEHAAPGVREAVSRRLSRLPIGDQ